MLRAAIEHYRPPGIIMFGLHMRIERIRIEKLARNRRELGRPDADGEFPAGPGVADGPETLPGQFTWALAAAALRRCGLSFEWSNDAGGYLCNQIYFRTAMEASALGVDQFAFFHVPPTDEIAAELDPELMPQVHCSIPAPKLEEAARALVEVLMDIEA